jgi:DNA-directed RNA polymerase specialized sigma24 family protein
MTFQDLYTGNELLSICRKITNNHDLTDDLYQEVLLCLLEYDKNKLAAIEAQGSNNIKFFAVRIVMTMWRSPRSTFNYKYRKHLHDELNENINVVTFDETKTKTYDEAGIQDYIQEQEKSYGSIGKYPYDARILQHYIAEGSIRKLHRETGIPTSAIHFSLKKSKRQIKDYMNNQPYKVLMLRNVPESGVEYHRCLIPAHHIADNYKHIDITLINTIDQAKADFFKSYQLLVITRQASRSINPVHLINTAKQAGCKVLYDIDDYWVLPNDHVLYYAYNREESNRVVDTIRAADYVTTTTSYLADKIKNYNTNVEVLPNGINPDQPQWSSTATESDLVRVGWQGGICHLPDIQMMADGMERLHDDLSINGKYQIVYGGFSNGQKQAFLINGVYEERPIPVQAQESYKYEKVFTNNYNCLSPDYAAELKKYETTNITTNEKYRRIWGKDIYNYGYLLDEMDVCLVPLKENEFNKCKSPLKLAEAGFKKKPCIVSNIHPYQPHYNGSNYVPVEPNRSHKDWYKQIKRMIESPAMREDYGNALYESVKHKFHIDTVNKKRVQLWNFIVNGY